mmetsp:Transcript_15708/g.49355  ORF Transcript_15708/g.49355 Transcript_15708/m.49355 type:complete len:348 (+) Transcript_15708:1295-2338(+)
MPAQPPVLVARGGEGEHHPQALGVRLVGALVLPQHDDAARLAYRHLLEVAEQQRVARAADYAAPQAVEVVAVDLLLHLLLVLVGHHHHRAPALALVRQADLLDQGEQLLVPPQDEGVTGFKHVAAPLLQIVHLLPDGLGDDPKHQRSHQHAAHTRYHRHHARRPPRDGLVLSVRGEGPVDAHPRQRLPHGSIEGLGGHRVERQPPERHQSEREVEEGHRLGVRVGREPRVDAVRDALAQGGGHAPPAPPQGSVDEVERRGQGVQAARNPHGDAHGQEERNGRSDAQRPVILLILVLVLVLVLTAAAAALALPTIVVCAGPCDSSLPSCEAEDPLGSLPRALGPLLRS